MRRREFVAGLGSAAASLPSFPLAVRAEQPTLPVIGLLSSAPFETFNDGLTAFRRGLAETGHVEGRNVAFESRTAENHYDRLPALADDLVNRRVDVIFALGGTVAALAAKAATPIIPIVFANGGDPVQNGLVATLNRPGGNVTGVSGRVTELLSKRLELLHELVPTATSIGYLVNPVGSGQGAAVEELEKAARALGIRMIFANATTPEEIEPAVEMLVAQGIGALYAGTDLLFNLYGPKIVPPVAARFKLPTIYHVRSSVDAGGLLSYETDTADAWRIAGTYVGRILKGEKPADLPAQQATKIELVINMKTAKALGLTFPTSLLVRADELIE
jgi:putative tryptophan/tyrosine transport system substrate-binding protein